MLLSSFSHSTVTSAAGSCVPTQEFRTKLSIYLCTVLSGDLGPELCKALPGFHVADSL